MTSVGASLVAKFAQSILPRPGGAGAFEAPQAGAVADADNADPASRGPATIVELSAGAEEGGGLPGQTLTEEEKAQVRELKERDTEVRRHEQAHARAGGQHAGMPSYEYQTGPDGKQYAIGGTTPIDISPIPGDPAATIEKMRAVKAAASAPAEPSGQDRAIAVRADAQLREARAELAKEKAEGSSTVFRTDPPSDPLDQTGPPLPEQAVLAYRGALGLLGS
ncbi:MAG: putative metalloprotease CJM1_0395 family protein [Proteobacteria bacterium]|nr:putative metalloprotease CJM1_0395 family protein [Pseudomonadota bacterium]